MAGNLQRSGCDLVVHNRTRDKGASLVSKGASWADTPAAVAEQEIYQLAARHGCATGLLRNLRLPERQATLAPELFARS